MTMASPRAGLEAGFRPNKKMTEPVSSFSVLGPQCDAQRERIRKLFDNGASAQDTLRQLCELADGAIKQVFAELLAARQAPAQGFCLLALGGYGREMLFPHSDLDLLFLFGNEKSEEEFRPLIGIFADAVGPGISRKFGGAHAGRVPEERRRQRGIPPGHAGPSFPGRRRHAI